MEIYNKPEKVSPSASLVKAVLGSNPTPATLE